MKLALKILASLVVLLVLLAAGGYAWISMGSSRKLAQTYTVHAADFPIPFPPGDMPDAVERGRHLLESRYACNECHGRNLGGGTMIDAPVMGRILGPNLTRGRGSRTASYRPTDWDRIVRHGVLPDGRPAAMPSEDFRLMSDQELSDIVAYITSLPPVDNVVPAPTWGPIGKMLIATGQLPLSADRVASLTSHPATPPPTETTVEFGRHIAAVCMGCHQENYAGGRIVSGDPSWPPARNLTPHAEGLANWSYEQFTKAMRDSVRPDGTPLKPPMTLIAPYAKNITDVEMQALWKFLQSLPPTATNK